MAVAPNRLTSVISFRSQAGKKSTFEYVKNFRLEDVGNITLSLDASDYSSILFRQGTQVRGWVDNRDDRNPIVFGLAFDTGNPIYNATGFNGLPTISFSQGRSLKKNNFTLSSNDEMTIFLVGSLDQAPTQNSTMFRAARVYGETSVPLDIGSTSVNSYNWFGTFDLADFLYSANNTSISNTQPSVVAFTLPPGASLEYLYLNAGTMSSSLQTRNGGTRSLAGEWNTVFLGTDGVPGMNEQFWGGSISEVLVYDTNLSETNIQKVSAYLGQKWGFKSTLSSPYNDRTVYYPVRTGDLVFFKNFTA